MAHVFISYSKKNKIYADKLAEHLKANGFDVWIDDRIEFGVDWWKAIEKAIIDAAACIVIMSPDAEQSNWVQTEITLIFDRNKPLFPMLLEGEKWTIIGRRQYVNVADASLPQADFLENLGRHVERKTSRGVDITHSPQRAAARSIPNQPSAPKLTLPQRRNLLPFGVILLIMLATVLILPNFTNRSSEPTATQSRTFVPRDELVFQPSASPRPPVATYIPTFDSGATTGGVTLGRMVSSSGINANGCPVNITHEFAGSDEVYIVIEQSDIPAGTTVFVRLWYEGTPIEDADVITADRDYENTCVYFVFDATDAAGILDSGFYEAQIIVNGYPSESVSFEVR